MLIENELLVDGTLTKEIPGFVSGVCELLAGLERGEMSPGKEARSLGLTIFPVLAGYHALCFLEFHCPPKARLGKYNA